MESPAAVRSKSSNRTELAPTVSFIEKFRTYRKKVWLQPGLRGGVAARELKSLWLILFGDWWAQAAPEIESGNGI